METTHRPAHFSEPHSRISQEHQAPPRHLRLLATTFAWLSLSLSLWNRCWKTATAIPRLVGSSISFSLFRIDTQGGKWNFFEDSKRMPPATVLSLMLEQVYMGWIFRSSAIGFAHCIGMSGRVSINTRGGFLTPGGFLAEPSRVRRILTMFRKFMEL